MQSSAVAELIAFGVAAVFVVLLPIIRTGPLLFVIVTLRALTDIGISSGGSLLPSATISAALGAAAVLAALVPTETRLTKRIRANVSIVYLFILIGTIVPVATFGLDSDLLKEPLRLASIVAIFVLSFKYSTVRDNADSGAVLVTAILPALILICTFLLQIPATLSDASRGAGTFSHPNAAAAFFSVAGTFCFASWWSRRSRPMLFAVVVSLAAALMTGSLGGIISLVVGMIVVCAASSRLKAIQKFFLFLSLIALGIAAYNLFGGTGRLAEFESFNASSALQSGNSSDSLEWRLINWRLLMDYWQLKPLLGHGLGTTYTYIMPLGGPPHSLFVQVLVEVGLIGCATIAFLWASNIRAAVRKLREGRWEAAAIIGLMSILVVNGSESNLLGYTPAMYALALYGGLLCANLARATGAGEHGNESETVHLTKRATSLGN